MDIRHRKALKQQKRDEQMAESLAARGLTEDDVKAMLEKGEWAPREKIESRE